MISTPIEKLGRRDPADAEHEGMDGDESVESCSVREGDEEDDDDDDATAARAPPRAPLGKRSATAPIADRRRTRCPVGTSSSSTKRSGRGAVARALSKGDPSTLLQIVCTADFAKATALTFAIIAAVFLSPLSRMLCDKVPMLTNVPRCDVIVPALVTALIATAARPPQIDVA